MRLPPSPLRVLLTLSATLAVAPAALAQPPTGTQPPAATPQAPAWDWPEKAKNLKVLPSDTPKERLRETMMAFTRGLGVRCNHCHVGEDGKPLSTFDFASDKNPKKAIARDMMAMVGEIRTDLQKMKLEGPHRVAVGCVTCHHGRPTPATLVEELAWTYETSGIDSTLAAYQALRSRFYGRNAYDFGEGSLVELGTSLSQKGKHEDALRIMKLNVDTNPNSSRAQEGLAEAYAAAGRKDEAVQAFRKALTLDPKNRNAERRIRELTGG